MTQEVTSSLSEAHAERVQEWFPVPGISSASLGVVPAGSPGSGKALCFVLEVVPERMVIKPASVAFPELLRLTSFNKVCILL